MERLLFLLMDNLIMIVESILLFLFTDMFLHRRWRGAAPLLPAIAISWCAQFLMARLAVGQGKIIVSIALDFVFLLTYYQQNRSLGDLLKKLFLLASFYVSMAATQAISIASLYHFRQASTADLYADPVLAGGAYTISLLLNMLCLHFCERFRRVETVPLSNRSWLSLLATPVVSITFVWSFFPFGRKIVDDYALLLIAGLSIGLLFTNLFVFCLYRNIARTTALQCRHEDLQQYCEHLNTLLQSEGKRRDVIHDYLHNLGVITALIESGCANDAATFIYRLESRIRKIHAVKYTGNQEIDAILSSKLPRMEEHSISFAVEGILPPTMSFDFLDICALLSNALDNALEACIRQEMAGEVIALRVSFQHGFFKLELSNPISVDYATHYYRRQREGRGLPIMRSVADRYEGVLTVSIRDGRCILSAMLQQPLH